MTADNLAVLQAAEGEPRLAKHVAVFAPLVIEPCGNVGTFYVHRVSVSGLDDAELLLRKLESRPDTALVRGEPLVEGRGPHRRRAHPRPGEPATFTVCSRRLLAIDMDGLPLPPDVPASDIEACGEAARRELPTEFNPAACVVQATGSHGLKSGARLRLWYMCDRPIADAEAAHWLRDVRYADKSLYGPAQLHYTAAPTFGRGLRDHLPRRLARLPGAPFVVCPPPANLIPQDRNVTATLPRFTSAESAMGTVKREFAAAIGMIRRADIGERHNTIIRAAARTAGLVKAGWLSEAAWRSGGSAGGGA